MNFDLYKKRILGNGGNEVSERIKDSEIFILQNFKDDPSYRDATLTRTDLTTKDIGVRVINIDSRPNEKKLYVLPGEDISIGDYISFTHKDKKHTYLIDSFEDNLMSPCAKGVNCKNILKWIDKNGNIQEFPCVVSYQSYGVKIFQANNEFIQETSTNIDIEIPRNPITESIPLSLRIMFGNSKHGIYKVGDIAVYEEGILKLTCKKHKYLEGLDDIENNLPWNGDLPSEDKPIEYIITGSDSIRKGQVETYTINNLNGEWQLEDDLNSAEIISQDNSQIRIKCKNYGDFITLRYLANQEIKIEKDISLIR